MKISSKVHIKNGTRRDIAFLSNNVHVVKELVKIIFCVENSNQTNLSKIV